MYTIAKAKDALMDGIRGYLLKDEHGKYVMKEVNRLPFYLEGSPGIGKTEIVNQIAKELDLGYVSFSLVHHTRNSLLGLPVIKELENGDKYTCYTMSEIIAKVLEQRDAGYQEGILLLDEFPCMSETILPVMLSFLQTKNIGAHRLPEGWVIVLCGNPPEYNKTARTFDAAIMDRIRKMNVEFQAETFLKYAEDIHMHQAVLDYLKVHEKHVYRCKNEKKAQELVTCRGWENVSHMLKTYETLKQNVDRDAIRQYIKSEEISAEFYQFYEQFNLNFTSKCAEDILNDVQTDDYVKKYQTLAYDQKWRLLDYIFGYLGERYKNMSPELEIYLETEQMLTELELLQARETDCDDDDDYYFFEPVTSLEAISSLRRNGKLSLETEIRQLIMDEWEEYAKRNFKKEEVMEGDNLYDRSIKSLREWQEKQKRKLPKTKIMELSEKLTRLFTFAEQIDQERSLLEMLFRKINSSNLLLMVLNDYPNASYLDFYAKRYNL